MFLAQISAHYTNVLVNPIGEGDSNTVHRFLSLSMNFRKKRHKGPDPSS